MLSWEAILSAGMESDELSSYKNNSADSFVSDGAGFRGEEGNSEAKPG